MTAAMIAAAAMPVSAQVFTTGDGVLSIETPEEENWAELQDPKVWYTISDGSCVISIDHLSNGETLPAIQIANDDYEGVTQTFISTKNEVFVIKAMSATQEELSSLLPIVESVKILKYDTKKAIEGKNAVQVSDFGLRVINETWYVTADKLNVRSGCSVDDPVLGTVSFGEEVKVTAAVTKNGEDFGWCQILSNGGTGYVAASFLSKTKPSAQTEKQNETGETFTVYDSKGGNQGSLTKKSDGFWYSNDGQAYKSNGDGSFYGVNTGDTLYNYNPTSQNTALDPADRPGAFMVWDRNGNYQGYLAPRTDGDYYVSNDNQPYVYNGDGSYYGTNTGDTLYDYKPSDTGYATGSYYHELSSVDTGAYVFVTADYEDSYVWTDAAGTQYQNNGDGTFTDYYGNDYNMID